MDVVHTIRGVREAVAAARREGKRIGFVPTMGALHAGHAALIDRCVAECDYTVVSIFVNPLQFGPTEDLDRYPRDLEADVALCKARGVDLVFAPAAEEMYPGGAPQTFVDVHGVTETLCGASRPGHFRGVATVVAKLFHIVAPGRAYFGQKDYQQLVVVRRMVHDLNFPLEIVPVETVREPDGLAMSSRNRYLSPEERRAAGVLYQALVQARDMVIRGERDWNAVRAAVRRKLAEEPLVREDYVEVVDPDDLRPLTDSDGGTESGSGAGPGSRPSPQRVVVAVAAFVGPARLIDNMIIDLQ